MQLPTTIKYFLSIINLVKCDGIIYAWISNIALDKTVVSMLFAFHKRLFPSFSALDQNAVSVPV